jgi:hypothetical protein
MWIAKGIALGLAIFISGLFIRLVVGIIKGPIESNHATGLGVIFGATIWNPFFYIALLGCLLIGISIVGSQTTPVP